MTSPDKSVLSLIAGYSGSHYFRQALGLVTAFIRPRLLPPELFGLWNLLKVLPEYAAYSQLGARSAMRFIIPGAETEGDEDKVRRIQGSGYWGSLVPNLAVAAVICLVAMLPRFDTVERTGLLAMAVVVLLNWRYDFLISLLKSYRRFPLISVVNIIAATVTFCGSLALIYFFGIYGAFVTAMLVPVAAMLFIGRHFAGKRGTRFHLPTYKEVLRTGFPLMLFDSVEVLLRTSDRFVIAGFAGAEQVGYYGLAIMLTGFMLNVPGASREIVESELMYNLSSLGPDECFRRYCIRPMVNTAYLMPVLVGPAFFLMPLVIPFILPRYAAGVAPAQIMAFGGLFMGISFAARGIIVARGRQMQAALCALPMIGINVGLSALAMSLGYGIQGVAAASSASFALLLLILLAFVFVQLGAGAGSLAGGMASLAVPLAGMAAAMLGAEMLVNLAAWPLWLSAGAKTFLFLAAMAGQLCLARNTHTVPLPFGLRGK